MGEPSAMWRVSTLIVVLVICCLSVVAEESEGNLETLLKDIELGNVHRVESAIEANENLLNHPHTDGNTALHLAAQTGDVDLVNMLLDNDADVNIQNDKGATPLHLAIINNFPAVVRLLLPHRPSMSLAAEGYGTPLMTAAVMERMDLLKLLKQYRIVQSRRGEL